MKRWKVAGLVCVLGVAMAAVAVRSRFMDDMDAAAAHASRSSTLIETRCGPIEYQEVGAGIPLLSVHGSGGGFDQGMAFAGGLSGHGIRVIAMSRFGYLRTPVPVDASAEAQADAHVCLLDALGLQTAAVLGGSAGAPSALQMAIRHPDRVNALILLVPLTYRPPTVTGSAAPMPVWVENTMMTALGSDFLFWTATKLARKQLIRTVLATPPELVASASPAERARIDAMLEDILPVSSRAAGLRNDTAASKSLAPAALDTITAPTLIISARDDGYGTYASARYTADRIPGARFVGFEHGGHTFVGHNDAVMAEIRNLLVPTDGSDRP
ncbi:MAG: alpha/beta hydrolase [Alphaproteobacteria bacterium]|nr:MAG: alpha/beta hydrolase [Alphaproteobacteria bacterium]PZO35496.1 MAG: alpha/beta hydrolase [Alphaproteobacteria bacterium]